MTISAPFLHLFRSSIRYRSTCIAATACSILNKFFDIAPEVLIGVAVDVVVQQQDSFLARFGLRDVNEQLIVLCGLTLVIWIMESIFEYLYSILWRNLAQTVQHDLRTDAYRHVQQLDVSFFEKQSSGSLVAVLNDDINQLERFLDGGANSLIQVASTVVMVGAIFFILAPEVAIWAMVPIPIILTGAFFYQRRAEPLYATVRLGAANLAGKLAANISGIATIKSQTAEAYELEKITAESESYRAANRKAISVSSAFVPLIRMAILAGFIATLYIGGKMTLENKLAVGSFGVLVFLTQRLLWPLTGLAQTVDLYQRAKASTARVLGLIDTPIKALPGTKPLHPTGKALTITVENVGFAYSERHPLFNHLNLTIPSGQSVALVGSTGSGKSTIAKLLLRFYDPDSGRILVDGQDIRETNPHDLRRAIGFVSQDVFLFDGTIRENIRYGIFSASDDDIIAASKIADAHEFIAKLPAGYDTLIGERGTRLSGGQRQRLAIARAVLKNPALMILDEATSAVDNESERLIQLALERIARDRTMVMIAHRLSTIRNCDIIYVLDHGKVVEQGRHDELISRNGHYAWLWKVQTGAIIADEKSTSGKEGDLEGS
jgi:ATP-binding cassette subfamily B protein